MDQTRVWVSLLQEENLKWEAAQAEARRREETRLAEEAATSKAASPVVSTPGIAELPNQGVEVPPKSEVKEEADKPAGTSIRKKWLQWWFWSLAKNGCMYRLCWTSVRFFLYMQGSWMRLFPRYTKSGCF